MTERDCRAFCSSVVLLARFQRFAFVPAQLERRSVCRKELSKKGVHGGRRAREAGSEAERVNRYALYARTSNFETGNPIGAVTAYESAKISTSTVR